MMKEFGCVLPFLLPNYSQPVCKLSANDIRRPGQKSIWDLYELVSAQQRSLCQMPCKKMSVIFDVVDESLAESDFYHNRSYYQIYLKSTVRYTETVADYPITTMLAGMKLESENFRIRSRLRFKHLKENLNFFGLDQDSRSSPEHISCTLDGVCGFCSILKNTKKVSLWLRLFIFL